MKKVDFFGKTDMGKIRTNNEDAFQVCKIWDEDHVLAVVIDGVGGYEGGEVAAALAREVILEYLTDNSQGDCLEQLKQAVITANNRIYKEREHNPVLANMSCVLTAALIELDSMRVNIAHVGDTRLYQYSGDQLEKLSHDHSLVGYREEIGDLTEEEAMRHPQRNIISRDVGSCFLYPDDDNYVEVASYPLESRTQLLLCSDGLCDMVSSKVMTSILSMEIPVGKKTDMLIEAALNAGGKDNVTVILVEIESDEVIEEDTQVAETPEIHHISDETVPDVPAKESAPRKRSFAAWLFLLVFIAGFGAGVLTRPMLFNEGDDDKLQETQKISADTNNVITADTLNITDSLNVSDTSLTSVPDQPDAEIHDDVSDEDQ